ncbi:ABC transporter ATP-binding protein [Microbacterium sp. No. 7]|uniref:ABC transporter ATP-binding protein n=1 Tax=Microbacterium sp. No. 7 TaxID=1714373 RepID=UPI0018D111A6|nr:ABC transporter ATP-binding protein [Microbacterium sp. No. 7]
MTAIAVSDLTVSYLGGDGTPLPPVLRGVDLRIASGECVLITGASGCGKTTLLRTINGLVPGFFDAAVTGSVVLDGQPVDRVETRELARSVGMVFQDPRAEFFTYDVTSELAFPCENFAVSGEEIRRRVEETADLLQMRHLLGRRLTSLSSGQKQKVAIAAAMMLRPRVLLFDEPSANLDRDGLRMLRDTVERLTAAGVTVLIADHRIEYLTGALDRLLVLERGRVLHDLTAADVAGLDPEWFSERALRLPVSRPLHEPVPSHPDGRGPRLQGVRLRYRGGDVLWQTDDLSLPDRGVIGIAGPNGSGKTSLLRLIIGAHRARTGTITRDGARWPARRRIRDCAYVMQDIDYQLLGRTVQQELLIGPPRGPATERRAAELLEQMGLDHLRDRHPLTLSGGQKQRLGIALAAMKQAEVICLDEPTSGLDAGSMRRVSELLTRLADQGALVVVATHDEEFAARTVTGWVDVDSGRLERRNAFTSVSDPDRKETP